MFVWKDVDIEFIDGVFVMWVFKGDNQDIQLS